MQQLVEGETVVDPTVVSRLVGRPRVGDPLEALSDRERQVLALVAAGLSSQAIAARLGCDEGGPQGARLHASWRRRRLRQQLIRRLRRPCAGAGR